MAQAIVFNDGHVEPTNLAGIINDLHTLVQDNELRDAARAENVPGSLAFARLVFAVQVQLFPDEDNLDGQFGDGTRTALTQRIQTVQGYANSGNQTVANADDFIQQLAPMTEGFESRRASMYPDSEGKPTVGVGFNLQRADAQQRIEAVGANYQNILNGNEALTDDQIDNLFFQDLEEIGRDVASDLVDNFDQLPLIARLVLADMAFNLGQPGLTGFANMIAAFEINDFHAAADEMVNSNWFNQVGRRAHHHVSAIRFLASSNQDPQVQTVPAGHHNLGFDYVIENEPDEEIRAWYGGLVTFSGLSGGYGNRIIIETDVRYNYQGDDYAVYTAYGHNDQNLVSTGEIVQARDVIGEMGGTGTGGQDVYPQHVDLRTWIMVNRNRIDISPNELERQLAGQQQAEANPAPQQEEAPVNEENAAAEPPTPQEAESE